MSNRPNSKRQAGDSAGQAQPTPQSSIRSRNISALCDEINGFYHRATADVNFVFDVDGNKELVPAHKSILASHSPMFQQMFYGELKETGDIKLKNTTIKEFVELLRCIYDGLIIDGLSESDMSGLLYLAHKYDIDWLEKKCKKILDAIIDIDVRSILWVIPLAALYSYNELQQKCIYQIYAHGHSLIELPEFIDREREVLEKILGVDFIDRNEVKVFEACSNWAKRACEKEDLDSETPENIRMQLSDCFDLIRFDSMTVEEFMQCLSFNSDVFRSGEIQQIASKLTATIPSREQRNSNRNANRRIFYHRSPIIATISTLPTLSEDKTTANVTFVFKNKRNEDIERLTAHKSVLAKKSSVFAHQFKDTYNSNDEVDITGATADAFKDFLRIMYADISYEFQNIAKDIAEQHIDGILSMAKTYKVERIIELYPVHLIRTLNEQNVILRFVLSRKHSLNSLKLECKDFMKKSLSAYEAFFDCSQPILKAILELHTWKTGDPLINASIKWAKNYCQKHQLDPKDPKSLRDAFGDAFELVPFSLMDPLDFIDFQGVYGDMFTYDELKKLMNGLAKRRKLNHP